MLRSFSLDPLNQPIAPLQNARTEEERLVQGAIHCPGRHPEAQEERNGTIPAIQRVKTLKLPSTMLRSIKNLLGYPIEATDGNIGKVKDFLFDDEKWGIRYLVADTGGWLSSHQVLISPRHLVPPDPKIYAHRFPVTLTKDQVESSPLLETDEPISRRFEKEYAEYYGHEPYWIGADMWGASAYAHIDPSPEEVERHEEAIAEIEQTHLRSTKEVIGYQIASVEDKIGHVEDLILDTSPWRIRHFVVATRHWLPGRKVIIDIDWMSQFDWATSCAQVNLTKDQIQASPPFDPKVPVNRTYEEELYDFYGRPYYWE
tara:strand:- start:8625 stop:9569 length:945 start_codon:yes stop_codon:yes gene_type:complete